MEHHFLPSLSLSVHRTCSQATRTRLNNEKKKGKKEQNQVGVAGIAAVIGVAATDIKVSNGNELEIAFDLFDRDGENTDEADTIEGNYRTACAARRHKIALRHCQTQKKSRQEQWRERERQQQPRSASSLAVFPNFICNAH